MVSFISFAIKKRAFDAIQKIITEGPEFIGLFY